MERLLLIDLDERPLPRTKCRALEDVSQQAEASSIVEGICHDQLDPGFERDVKGVRILEFFRLALIDDLLCIHTQVAHQSVGDMGMSKLILNDGSCRAKRVERWRMLAGVV